jgi:outer membrane protein TolC
MRKTCIIGILCLLLTQCLGAQQDESLSLERAVAIAVERSPQHKAALADTHAAKADFEVARSFYFPRLTFSEAATRSNDPVYVFGTRLRQSRFTAQDFALDRLNNPTPIGNFATRFGAQWSVFDSFATTFNARKAEQLRSASTEQLTRTDQLVAYRVIQAYYAVLFSRRQVELAEHEVSTAQAVSDQSRARLEAGMSVESDLLAAQVELASRRQDLVKYRNSLALSLVELNLAMGLGADNQYTLTGQLAERILPPVTLTEIEAHGLKQRSDLRAMEATVKASQTGVQAARSAYGPRINVFAASELNNVSPFSNGSNNWTAGAELQFDLFSGGEKSASVSRARADLERMQALKQAAEDRVRLEIRRAYYDFDNARQVIDVTKAATGQAEEGLRIVSNRYEGGMATITELLRAEDAARAARTNYWEAVYRFFTSYAAVELAAGSLNSQSPVVMP